MEDIIFYESLQIAKWKSEKYQKIYDKTLDDLKERLIKYIHDDNYGEIDIKNKSITISYKDGSESPREP
jgi:frataxin-like iron-binding protein CyaY